MLVDDTQAVGILGESANDSCPYGIGGGGSLRHEAIHSDEVVVVNSLAKAFGVPVSRWWAEVGQSFRWLRSSGLMRTHGSPPSVAEIGAAAQAIQQNRRHGETLRARLAHNVAHLRRGLNQLGIVANRSLFPVQPSPGLHLAPQRQCIRDCCNEASAPFSKGNPSSRVHTSVFCLRRGTRRRRLTRLDRGPGTRNWERKKFTSDRSKRL